MGLNNPFSFIFSIFKKEKHLVSLFWTVVRTQPPKALTQSSGPWTYLCVEEKGKVFSIKTGGPLGRRAQTTLRGQQMRRTGGQQAWANMQSCKKENVLDCPATMNTRAEDRSVPKGRCHSRTCLGEKKTQTIRAHSI